MPVRLAAPCRRQDRSGLAPGPPRGPVSPAGPVSPPAPTTPVSPHEPVLPCGPSVPVDPHAGELGTLQRRRPRSARLDLRTDDAFCVVLVLPCGPASAWTTWSTRLTVWATRLARRLPLGPGVHPRGQPPPGSRPGRPADLPHPSTFGSVRLELCTLTPLALRLVGNFT